MPQPIIPLVQVFVEIPDWRARRGRRYSLAALLALACAAILGGVRSYSAIAEWGRNYGQAIARQLGFADGRTPCAATLHTVFRHLDVDLFERQLAAWAEQVLQTAAPGDTPAVAIDGKTLRGSAKQGAPGSHLLAAVSHHLGLTLGQTALADKASELSHIEDLLAQLVLHGRIITVDALHTQRAVAQTIIDGGGDYIMLVKDNQPALRADIETLFTEPSVVQETLTQAQTTDLGHGRIETRHPARQHGPRGLHRLAGLAAGLPPRTHGGHQTHRPAPPGNGLWRQQSARPAGGCAAPARPDPRSLAHRSGTLDPGCDLR